MLLLTKQNIEVLLVDFSLYDEFRTRLGIPWVLLRFHELVTFYCRISLFLKVLYCATLVMLVALLTDTSIKKKMEVLEY